MAAYTITTDVFRGPLDLLLTLIEKRKLLINDISLSEVTDDFISHLKQEEAVPLPERAHFVLIASTLLLIKSKSLLPTLELSEEETASVQDLERRLKLYRRFRELARIVQSHYGKRALYLPMDSPNHEPLFTPAQNTTAADLLLAIKAIMQSLPKKEFVPKAIVEKVISLEETIEQLTTRVTKHMTTSFQEFTGMGKKEKIGVIVGFLAMLELVKQGIISVQQDSLFSDITMETDSVNTPRYG